MIELADGSLDAWLMGNAWVGSRIHETLDALCHQIGVRWAGTAAEKRAAELICDRFQSLNLPSAVIEPFELQTWNCEQSLLASDDSRHPPLPIRPSLFCPSVDVTAPLIDVGYGMEHELDVLAGRLAGAVVLINTAFEPFSTPKSLAARLESLAAHGVKAAICFSPHFGRRLTLISASDWHSTPPLHVPLPLVQVAREQSTALQHVVKNQRQITLTVQSAFPTGTSWNTFAQIPGDRWPDESIVLAAHHDTTPESPGANDNATGVAVLLEVARLLGGLLQESGRAMGRTIRFISFGAEEQGLQGSSAYVREHHGDEPRPRLMLNLDELGVGTMKGIVLQFPELRPLIQHQLDAMNEGLQCHVLDQFDSSGDMFPFARAGIPSGMMWRWRFVGRHSHAEYGHCSSDTPEKLRLRELKEYAGNLARLLYRLSHVPPDEWPVNRLDTEVIAKQITSQRGNVLRTM